MEKLKKRYILLDTFCTCLEILFYAAWIVVVTMYLYGYHSVIGRILLMQAGLLAMYSLLGMLTLKSLKTFFLKGCETGEDVFEQYGVRLNYPKKIEDSLPEIKSITFHRKWYAYTIKVYYTNYGIREILLNDTDLNNLEEYIVFD